MARIPHSTYICVFFSTPNNVRIVRMDRSRLRDVRNYYGDDSGCYSPAMTQSNAHGTMMPIKWQQQQQQQQNKLCERLLQMLIFIFIMPSLYYAVHL